MWRFKHLSRAFSCRPETHMLFFVFIWLHTGFWEIWKFRFITKTLGSSGCQCNYSPNHNRVVREQTRSHPASCMIRLIRENLTADNAFQKQRPWFCSQILHWPPKCIDFSSCKWSRYYICFPFFQRNWKDESTVSGVTTSHQIRSPKPWRNMQSAAHTSVFLALNAATPVTLLVPPDIRQLTDEVGFSQNTSRQRASWSRSYPRYLPGQTLTRENMTINERDKAS